MTFFFVNYDIKVYTFIEIKCLIVLPFALNSSAHLQLHVIFSFEKKTFVNGKKKKLSFSFLEDDRFATLETL